MNDASAEKIARNNAAFRAANDQIEAAAVDHGFGRNGAVPFLCECSDPHCTQIIRLSLAEYDHVRSNARWFVHAEGHESEIPGVVRLVERREGYLVVEKTGHAGAVVTELAIEEQAD
jgi:hypothetical protein